MPDALQILREDHRKVKDMFRQFEETQDQQTKKALVDKAILELTVHADLEEQIFYPAVRREGGTEDMIDEAEEEHHVAEVLMVELRGMKPSDERWEAKFKVLSESVKMHIEEEEANTLPKAAELGPDALQRIGQEMEMRRPELMQQAQRSGSSRGRSSSRSTGRGRSRSTARRTTRASGGRSTTRRTTTASRGTTRRGSTSGSRTRRTTSGSRSTRSSGGSRSTRSSARSTRSRSTTASGGMRSRSGGSSRSRSTTGSRGMRSAAGRGQSRSGRRTTTSRSRSRS